ncbi:MAG: hypothetical protein HYX40_10295 [Sphingobacteriales bacterium]|nr:hypothetical protein [Sphingobacteriales bacterium]
MGHIMIRKEYANIQSQELILQLDRNKIKPGVYFVTVTNLNAQTRITEKIIFQ